MKFAFALALALGIAMQADAADALGLEKGLFGIAWGESAAVIRSRFPEAVEIASGEQLLALSIKGKLSFAGHAVEIAMLRFEPDSKRLNFMSFNVRPDEQGALVQQLKAAMGEPRLMTTREGRIYDHIVEWSRPRVSVSLWAVTEGPQLTDAPAAPVSVRIQTGPLNSEIERAEKMKKAVEERLGTPKP